MRSTRVLVAVIVCGATSCGLRATSTPTTEYPVTGSVTAGPTCPVQQDPPDLGCADRPVSGAMLVVLDADGEPYGEIVVGPEGHFESRLPAGIYVLEPPGVEGIMGTPAPVEFEVGPGLTVEIDIQYDTGIR